MPILDDRTKDQVRPLLQALEHPVELKVLTGGTVVVPGRDATGLQDETLALLRELAALDERLTVQEAALASDPDAQRLGITRAPTVLFRRRGEARTNLRFAGLPGGYEFTTLLEAIRLVSAAPAADGAADATPEVHLQTFVTPSCPHCPRAVLTTFALALEDPSLVAEAVEAQEYPVASGRHRISSVPDTIVSGAREARVLGAQPREAFLEAIGSARSA